MDIHSFLPYEDTIVLKDKTDFNIKTPYVFIEIKNGDEAELILTLKQNIELSGGEVKSEAFIYADIVEFIKTKYNFNGEEGTIAIIGPKRMEYDRVVSLLDYIKDNIGGNDGE